MRPALFLAVALFALPVAAEEMPAPLPPPPLPDESAAAQAEKQEALQPEVTIEKRQGDVVEEYRVNGRLVMVKITPAKGYPYYIIDTDGDGRLDTRRNELSNPPLNQWILFRW